MVWERSLCDRAEEVLRNRAGPDTDIVVLAGGNLDQQAMIVEDAMHVGVHPLRVRFLEAGRLFRDPESLETHLRAAFARIHVSGNVEAAPSKATNHFRGLVPRRSLLMPFVRYRAPVPRVDPSRCRAASGCDLCVKACPVRAIEKGNPPHVDSAACNSCGLCLPACPSGAVTHPILDFHACDAEADALADGPHRNLLVVCTPTLATLAQGDLDLDPAVWRILEVPSLGALRPVEILKLLAKGFDRVVGLSRRTCCPGTPGAFLVAAALLEGLGHADRVEHWNLADGPLATSRLRRLPGNALRISTTETLQELAADLSAEGMARVDLPGRGAGLVAIDAQRCTVCGLCAARCWSEALRLEELEEGTIRLTFDHAACDACGLCEDVCPERILSVRQVVDTKAIGRRDTLKEDAWLLCSRCGARVAPRAMVSQVEARLKTRVDLDLCPDCKPSRMLASAHFGP